MKKNIYWKIYGVIVILAVAISVTLLIILWNFLSAYEKSQPKYEMEKVLDLFKNSNSNELMKNMTYEESAFENSDMIIKYVDSVLTDGQWEYIQKAGAYTKNTPVYNVTKDGTVVATVTLTKSSKKGSFGIKKWEIQNVDGVLSAKEDYEILAPTNSEVYINGIKVTSDYIKEKDIAVSDLANAAKYVTVPTMVKYSISGLITKPEITAIGGSYKSQLTATNDTDHSMKFAFESNQDFNNSQEARIIEFTKIYGNYVTNDVKFSSISPYVISNSHAYTFLKSISQVNIWYSEHTRPEFKNLTVSNYQIYTDSCYSCDVSFTLTLVTPQKTIEYPTNLRYYFVKTNKGWYIADLVIK